MSDNERKDFWLGDAHVTGDPDMSDDEKDVLSKMVQAARQLNQGIKITKIASGNYRVQASNRTFDVQRCGDTMPKVSKYIWCLYNVDQGIRTNFITSRDTRKEVVEEIEFMVYKQNK